MTVLSGDPFDASLRFCQLDVFRVGLVCVDVFDDGCGLERAQCFVHLWRQKCLLAVVAFQVVCNTELLAEPDNRLRLTNAQMMDDESGRHGVNE